MFYGFYCILNGLVVQFLWNVVIDGRSPWIWKMTVLIWLFLGTVPRDDACNFQMVENQTSSWFAWISFSFFFLKDIFFPKPFKDWRKYKTLNKKMIKGYIFTLKIVCQLIYSDRYSNGIILIWLEAWTSWHGHRWMIWSWGYFVFPYI